MYFQQIIVVVWTIAVTKNKTGHDSWYRVYDILLEDYRTLLKLQKQNKMNRKCQNGGYLKKIVLNKSQLLTHEIRKKKIRIQFCY